MGLTQLSTATLKAVGVSSEDASDEKLFHSLMAEGEKGVQMDVCSQMGNSASVKGYRH